ncbi:CDH13 isoform 11 [Pan troglodytes]|uniref:Cadherin 13 n=2 Tax=Homininae TaxID=207598 RepID=H3BRL7_HUMAN|nr:cadherin 13 [Homo sapiens]KAI4056279.1 cadherin 13 [Homo sapiens]PNI45704.1 CDH13 isoform 11 [Pan troglodytes]
MQPRTPLVLCVLLSQVLLLTSAEDLDCTPGFQQKVFHINQPAEFIEDQSILNCKQCHSKMLLDSSHI